MSAQRSVPSARSPRAITTALFILVVVAAAVAAYLAGRRSGAVQNVLSASPAHAERVAFVRKQRVNQPVALVVRSIL